MLAPIFAAAALAATPVLNPQHLPRLPPRGVAESTTNGVVLQTLRGRAIGILRGLHVAEPRATHGLLLQDGRGQKLAYDAYERRLRPVFPMPTRYAPGCRMVDATMRQELVVCGRHLDVVLVRPGATPSRRVAAASRSSSGQGASGLTWSIVTGEIPPQSLIPASSRRGKSS
jgi:hypothetical protein